MNQRTVPRQSWQVIGLFITLMAAMIVQGWWSVILLLMVVVVSAWFVPSVLRPFLRWRWLVALVLLIVPSALWVGVPDIQVAGVMLSRSGLQLGIEMASRATTIVIIVSVFSQSISVMELTQFFDRYGMRGLGFAIGVGFHALPTLKRRFVTAYSALRLRGGFRRRRWRAMQCLVITVVMGALRYGEEVVLAAEARAFDPNGE
jgi:energy-coupling factor transporter transmembrane protein EcfT